MKLILRVYKIKCREFLKFRKSFCVIEEERLDSFHLAVNGGASGTCFNYPEYDEEGDPLTEEQKQEIITTVKTIIDEHNANLPAPPEEKTGVMNKIKSWLGGS